MYPLKYYLALTTMWLVYYKILFYSIKATECATLFLFKKKKLVGKYVFDIILIVSSND